MTTSDLSAKIPPFNAQRMLTDVGAADARGLRRSECRGTRPPNPMPRFRSSPRISAPMLPKAKLAAVVALDEVLMRVRDASNWRGNTAACVTRPSPTPRPTPAAHSPTSNGLCRRGRRRRSLCRFRNPGGPGKRHAAAEDQGTGHRRQSIRRTRPRRQEGRHRHLDPARSGRHAGGGQGHRRHARRPWPRRRPEGRRETAHPDGARGPGPASGCSPTG